MFSPEVPFQELPLLPPKGWTPATSTWALLDQATYSLGLCEGALPLISNSDVLIRNFGLMEAQQSSEIEAIVTTSDELFKGLALGRESMTHEEKEVLHYREALWEGVNWIRGGRPLSTPLVEKLGSIVNNHQTRIRDLPGTVIARAQTGEVVYTPPSGSEHLRRLLDNLWQFVYSPSDMPPLLRMAIAHYQFEAIHPLPDGNGRVGRILNILCLLEANVLSNPVLFLSKYFLKNKSKYYALLRSVTENASWDAWADYVLTGVSTTGSKLHQQLLAIHELRQEVARQLGQKTPRMATPTMLDLLFREPYLRIQDLVDAKVASRETASHYLAELVKMGILEEGVHGRKKLFLNRKYLQVLKG